MGACFGPPAGSGIDTGNFGLTTSVGSAGVPGIALLFLCEGLTVLGVVKVGVIDADGGVVAVVFSGTFASELPH